MCGILGYYAFGDKRPNYDLLIESWRRMKSMGEDGCGMTYPDQDGVIVIAKSGDSIEDFLKSDVGKEETAEIRKISPKMALFHTRKATWGTGAKSTLKVTDSETAHPFCYKDKVILMHNGQIKNTYDLSKKYKFDNNLKVDSESLPILFYENKIWEDNNKFKEAVEEISGSFTIASLVVDTEKIYLATNNERPLVFALDEARQILYFCSELAIMGPLFVARHKITKKLWDLLFERDEIKYNGKAPFTLDTNKKTVFVIGPEGIEYSAEFTPKPYYYYASGDSYSYKYTTVGSKTGNKKTVSEQIKDGVGPIVFLLTKPANLDLESRCDNFIKACSMHQLVINDENKKVSKSFEHTAEV